MRTDRTLNTRSGAVLDLDNPDPESIKLDDIAGSLAMVPRFGAQTRIFYSVAQHAVSVALTAERLGRPELALSALHHDSHEAFICDLPSPVKAYTGDEYRKLADRIDQAIEEAFGIKLTVKESSDGKFIKGIDDAILVVEAETLLAGEPPERDVDPEVLSAARATMAEMPEAWAPPEGAAHFKATHHRIAAAN
jgi:5'-deoxynucleotidase YfbR-like HD superfamily hydrolase